MEIGMVCLVGLAAAPLLALALGLIAWSGRARGRNRTLLAALGGLLILSCACLAAVLAGLAMRGQLAGPATATPASAGPQATPQPPTLSTTATVQPSATPTVQPSPTPSPSPSPTAEPTPTLPPGASYAIDVTAYAPSLLPEAQEEAAALDDPPLYTLDVRVDWETHTVAGVETLLFTNNEGVALDRVYLRLYPNADHYAEGQIEVGASTVGGLAAETSVEGTVLELTLPQPLGPEERVELTVPFTVTVPQRPDRFGFYEDVMMLGHWYPMLAVYDDEGWNLDPYVEMGDAFYSDAGFYTVHLVVPEEMVVATTGAEADRISLDGGETRYTFVSGATRDFALALSPSYRTETRWVDATRVTAFYLPGDEEGVEVALDAAADSLEVFNARYGAYPYTEFDVAETPFLIGGSPGGMEFPGLIFISTNLYDPESWSWSYLDVIVAHETAHQWWYGVVGNNQVDEPWLDESFATFSQILYVEEVHGLARAVLETTMWLDLPYGMVARTGEDRPVATSLLAFENSTTYSAIVYSKGALFLRELRELVGDEVFFEILRHHYEAYDYGIVPPDGFRRSIAAVTGDEAEALALYDLWILSGETPPGFGN